METDEYGGKNGKMTLKCVSEIDMERVRRVNENVAELYKNIRVVKGELK